ncbi:hypothetical protein CN071_16350 [Sinorhizobium meliloti]|nr:hypothetical protein CN195_07675 [Sinorhizobium meliloti]RVP66179.1 hypothetical protein CN071_16350 [Sinorhizobium meliloti]
MVLQKAGEGRSAHPFLIALILVLRRGRPGASGTLDPSIDRVFTNETQTIAICMAKAQCADLR